MEAPEKIYLIRNFPSPTALNTTNDHHGKFLNEWYKSREKDADVQYTRTDAFIDKACEWLKNNSHNYADNALGKEYLVNDFKNFREGE